MGPRQTGKSTLVRPLKPGLTINLPDEATFVDFLRDPALLTNTVGRHKTVFIDEVKASRNVSVNDLRGLKSFADFYGKKHTSSDGNTSSAAHDRSLSGQGVKSTLKVLSAPAST